MEVSGVVDALGSKLLIFQLVIELLFLADKGAWLSMAASIYQDVLNFLKK